MFKVRKLPLVSLLWHQSVGGDGRTFWDWNCRWCQLSWSDKTWTSPSQASGSQSELAAERTSTNSDLKPSNKHTVLQTAKKKNWTLYKKDSGNVKHWPQARERQTKARAYWRERDHCGWTGRPTEPAGPETFVQHVRHRDSSVCIHHVIDYYYYYISREMGLTQCTIVQIIHRHKCLSFTNMHACWLLLLVFLTSIFCKVVYRRH